MTNVIGPPCFCGRRLVRLGRAPARVVTGWSNVDRPLDYMSRTMGCSPQPRRVEVRTGDRSDVVSRAPTGTQARGAVA